MEICSLMFDFYCDFFYYSLSYKEISSIIIYSISTYTQTDPVLIILDKYFDC